MGKLYILQILVLGVLITSCTESKTEEDKEGQSEQPKHEDTATVKVTAMDFNNTMVNYQNMAMKQVNVVFDTKLDELPGVIDETVFELKIYGEDLKALSKTTFDYGKPFVQSIKNLNDYYIYQFDQKLDSILHLAEDEQKNALDKYDDQFSDGEEALFDSIRVAQDQFAKYHKIELVAED